MGSMKSIETQRLSRKPIRVRNDDAEQWLHVIVNRLIERRAQEIFLEHGCRSNRDMENWLEAEAEIRLLLEEVEASLRLAMEAGVARNRFRNREGSAC